MTSKFDYEPMSSPDRLVTYVRKGVPARLKKGEVPHSVLGKHINQLANLAEMEPLINGEPCLVPNNLFCNPSRITNIEDMLDRVSKRYSGRFVPTF